LDLKLFEWLFHPGINSSNAFKHLQTLQISYCTMHNWSQWYYFLSQTQLQTKNVSNAIRPQHLPTFLATISSVLEPPMFGPPFHLRQMTSKPLGPHGPLITSHHRADEKRLMLRLGE
jgi:hypothetical protein